MALGTCGNADILRFEGHFHIIGAWVVTLTLDTAIVPSGQVTIKFDGGMSITGTVKRAGVFLDSVSARVVGGANGMGTLMPSAAYENAQLRDPLNAILSASGETLSSTVDSSITSVVLPQWTHVAQRAGDALDRLAFVAGQALGKSIGWRILGDGTLWLGAETWPSQQLAAGTDIVDVFPAQGRYVLGVQTPALLPGVALAGVGNVTVADHWFSGNGEARSWAWV